MPTMKCLDGMYAAKGDRDGRVCVKHRCLNRSRGILTQEKPPIFKMLQRDGKVVTFAALAVIAKKQGWGEFLPLCVIAFPTHTRFH